MNCGGAVKTAVNPAKCRCPNRFSASAPTKEHAVVLVNESPPPPGMSRRSARRCGSRVPFAAAVDGRFFRPFARLHPTKNFPSFSVVFIGITSALACLLNLDVLINALIVIQVLIQFMAQIIAVTLIRRNRPGIVRPFRMPLYPFTSIIAFLGWLYILVASGTPYIHFGFRPNGHWSTRILLAGKASAGVALRMTPGNSTRVGRKPSSARDPLVALDAIVAGELYVNGFNFKRTN